MSPTIYSSLLVISLKGHSEQNMRDKQNIWRYSHINDTNAINVRFQFIN